MRDPQLTAIAEDHQPQAQPRTPLVVVGCGAAKQDHRCPAGEMYTGGYHRAARKAAAAITTPERTLILSAAHGLLSLDTPISPYNLRMGDPGSINPAQLRHQATRSGLRDEPAVIVLAGQHYVRQARTLWPHAHAPLAGVGGIGKQLARLAQIAKEPDLALPWQPPTPGPSLLKPGLCVQTIYGVGPKTGGRYGGTLVKITPKAATVACHDGIQRRIPPEHLYPTGIIVDIWDHIGYWDPEAHRPITDAPEWDWLGWTLDLHLTYSRDG